MLSQNLKVERYILLKPIGSGDLLVYPFDSKLSSPGRLLLIPREFNRWILGSNGTVILLHNPKMLLGPEGPGGRLGTRRSFGNPKVPLDPEVAFRTQRSFRDPEVLDHEVVFRIRRLLLDPEVDFWPGGYKEPGGLPFPGPEEICSGHRDCLGTRRFLITRGL
ncbi:hypothetical protein F2Q69_00052731 [Brassica cretica]|uniref:Uncharacterized protein n=1 Tax=Brassica cretica TaxID=69181 RepID=A0A8S9N324_BRACR|nr:hypothetical protein F2Q69_00052731 [Brassica cretica]